MLVAEALWLVQKRLRMGKVVWKAQVLIPILYMLSNTLTIILQVLQGLGLCYFVSFPGLRAHSLQGLLGNDLGLGISLRSLGISPSIREAIVVTLGQV